jgi:sulfonate transport system permease protein
MATDQALHGLDNLESAPPPAGRDPGQIARRTWAATWPKLLAVALVLAVWELVALSGWKHYVLQGPGPVLANLWGQLLRGQLWGAIGNTLETAAVGYGIALVLGSVAGLLVARIPPLRAAVGSIITALQTMPSVAWVPFAIVIFGPDNSAILFVVILGAAPSIANGLITGVDYTPPLLLRAGKTMGLRGFALYRYLIMPASLPAFVAGMKQGWAFAWRSLMAGELLVLIAGSSSLGILLNNDQDQLDLTSAISVMITILIIGIVVDGVFTKLDLTIRNRRGLGDSAISS